MQTGKIARDSKPGKQGWRGVPRSSGKERGHRLAVAGRAGRGAATGGDKKARAIDEAMLKKTIGTWPFRRIEDLKPTECPPGTEVQFMTKAGRKVVWTGTKAELKERLEHQDTDAMAAERGINPVTICRWCKDIGLKLEKGSTSGFCPPSKEALEAALDVVGSAPRLAKIADVSPQTVFRACEEWGIDLQERAGTAGTRWQPAKEALEEEIYVKGKSLARIARDAGVDERTLYRRLKRHGIEVRKGAIDRIDTKAFARDVRENDSMTAIATKHGVSRETVKSLARRLGIPETEWAFASKPASALRQMPDDVLKRLVEAKTLKEIGQMTDRSETAVWHEVNQRGIALPRAKRDTGRPDAKIVLENGAIYWNGAQVAVGREHEGEVVFLEPHLNGQEVDVFADEKKTKFIRSTYVPFSEQNPVLRVDGLDHATRERLLGMDEATIVSMYRDRLDGVVTSKMTEKYGITYDELERLFSANRISPRELQIDIVKDYVAHHHPGAEVLSDELVDSKTHVDVQCEKGHETGITPNSILSGAWCGECFERQNFQGERLCRETVEKIFGKQFKKDHPDWMPRPRGRKTLELDMYNPELKIAVEYNGIQHYEYHEHFHHNDPSEFQRQVEYDALKAKACEKQGISLITVPYWIPPSEFESFIRGQLAQRGIIP
ncbi:MAG: hypothetical protein GYA24_18655 [Candidatus Lokiarchaeota archaeon]|nr:hypothetical protein [Candidatus Lokiarchaeota archaeon]